MRLIDADAILKTTPFTKGGGSICDYVEGYLACVDDTINTIENAPTIDAVEVVRCEDCLYWDAITTFCHCHSKYYDGGRYWDTFKHDDFCSYGERKEGDD